MGRMVLGLFSMGDVGDAWGWGVSSGVTGLDLGFVMRDRDVGKSTSSGMG